MISNFYSRLKSGETIKAIIPETGRKFDIQPEYWHGIVLGYSVLVDGQVVPTHKRRMYERETIEAWGQDIDERV